jgi:hypothetical protein
MNDDLPVAIFDYHAQMVKLWGQTYRDMVHRGDLGEIVYAEGEYIHDLGGLMHDQDGNLTWRTKLPPIMYPTHDLGPSRCPCKTASPPPMLPRSSLAPLTSRQFLGPHCVPHLVHPRLPLCPPLLVRLKRGKHSHPASTSVAHAAPERKANGSRGCGRAAVQGATSAE